MLNEDYPLTSIIIPCRNEERFIAKCLDSIINNDYPKDRLEVLIVDGMSDDGSRELVQRYMQQYPIIKLLNNPQKIVPTAMNIGINNAKGDIIIRMDAHAEYPKDYISKIIYWLKKTEADNIGGIWIILPGTKSLLAKSIAFALSSTFGVGNVMFRIGVEKPTYVDTVPFGAYKKEVFNKIGLFDEELIKNQDDEFNLRLIRSGGKILLVPEIKSYYYARPSLSKLCQQYYRYGYWKVRVIQKHKLPASIRHLVPGGFILSLIATGCLALFSKIGIFLLSFILGTYLLASLSFSIKIALKEGLVFFPILPITFACIHFSYGLGYLKGIWDFIIIRKHIKRKIEDMGLSR
jgi:glycosyltransferase involved in cell wall biosynthesis